MTLDVATWWWILAGVLVALELATGTFYLLMLALGAVAAALGAHGGLSMAMQLVVGAVVGGGATLAWHFLRSRSHDVGDRVASRDLSLDIGETVYVQHWQSDGSAMVEFRGSTWIAKLDGASAAASGLHTIVALEGNRLVLRPA